MKKIKIRTKIKSLLVFLGIGLFGLISIVYSAPLTDSADIFVVDQPRANSILIGNSTVRFVLYDDEDTTPDFFIALFQPNCIDRYATISDNEHSIKGASNVYTKQWNTDGPVLDKATIANGQYCLKVCTTLMNGASPYSVCDARSITLSDYVNQAPAITSQILSTNYLVGQNFYYDVDATDPEGSALTYRLTSAPDFLQINSSTGLVTSKTTLTEVGSFAGVVQVSDPEGLTASQQFNFTVSAQPEPALPDVLISNPTAESVFTGVDNKVSWILDNIDSIKKITVSYSTDGASWQEITQSNEVIVEYVWDVSDIDDGKYFVKVEVTLPDDTKHEAISDEFSISGKNDNVEPSASIIEVSPEEDSTLTSLDQIKMKLVPSDGATIDQDTLAVFLDDSDITDSCVLQQDELICNIADALEPGRHKISVSFKDTNDNVGEKTWYFNIEPVQEDNKGLATWMIILLICVVAGLLILIPWILYTLWRRNGRYEEVNVYDAQVPPAPVDAGDVNYDMTQDLSDTYYPLSAEGQTEMSSQTYDQPVSVSSPAPEPQKQEDLATGQTNIDIGQADDGVDEYDIGEGSFDEPAQPAAVVETQPTQPVQPIQPDVAPAPNLDANQDGQFNEEDIPAWLKEDTDDTDGVNSSSPVNPSGSVLPKPEDKAQSNEDKQGAELYKDYGLAKKED